MDSGGARSTVADSAPAVGTLSSSGASANANSSAGDNGPAAAGAADGTLTGTGGGDGASTKPATSATGPGDSGVSTSTPPVPNCGTGTNGVTNCGPGGSGDESCCTSLAVTGGMYDRTYTNSGAGPTGQADPAMVSDFRLDQYLVTVGRFREFVNAWRSGYMPPPGSGKHAHLNAGSGLANSASAGSYETGWLSGDDANIAPTDANLTSGDPYATWTPSPGANESLPINDVSWWEAYAFCIWDGGFLPSEAEWEYAAAGGSQEREYPWGSTDPGMGNQYAIYGDGESECYYPSGAATPCTGVANVAPVGYASKGAGAYGQLDITGEIFQWTLDWYAPYAKCTDCAYLKNTANRVMRGGLLNDTTRLLPPNRFDADPSFRAVNLGFRCARAPAGTATGPANAAGPTTGTTAGATPPQVAGMDASVVLPAGCTVPTPVSFQADVQGFLNTSCGKTGSANASNGGCHVLDDESTMIEGGKNHAYDWITGTAHASSCPETPTPFRFQVVMAVMQEADPATCSMCGKMPLATTPPHPALTACQLAILQTWLDEPYSAQFHRYDGISPTTVYAMPPWN